MEQRCSKEFRLPVVPIFRAAKAMPPGQSFYSTIIINFSLFLSFHDGFILKKRGALKNTYGLKCKDNPSAAGLVPGIDGLSIFLGVSLGFTL